jgi:uncharacterized protein (TIGR03000 family)
MYTLVLMSVLSGEIPPPEYAGAPGALTRKADPGQQFRGRGCNGCGGGFGCNGGGWGCRGGGCHGGGWGCRGGGCHGGGWGCTGGGWGCGGGRAMAGAWYGGGYVARPVWVNGAPVMTAEGRRLNGPAPATLVITLPEDATLMVGDSPTSSNTGQRVLVSPPLEPGREYYYTLKAETNRNGTPQTQTKTVPVRAGEETRVTFDMTNEQ